MQLQKLQDGRDLLNVTHTHKLIAELGKEISLLMKWHYKVKYIGR